MPDWWYAFSYDPLVASVVSGLVVGIAMIIPTYFWTHSNHNRPHCPNCCPDAEQSQIQKEA